MTEQLALFDPTPASLVRFITVCPQCGEVVDVSPGQDPAERWDHARTLSYVAQKAHQREHHVSGVSS